jgi:hypothetical protein
VTWAIAPDESNVFNDIGAIYQSSECDDQALINYRTALSIARQIGNLSQQVIALRGLDDLSRGSVRWIGAYRAGPGRARPRPRLSR